MEITPMMMYITHARTNERTNVPVLLYFNVHKYCISSTFARLTFLNHSPCYFCARSTELTLV